jgi:prepilin-type N-terminal cleavage/methylation domain-containing protein
MIYKHRKVLNQKAFTIIELMIATAILSVILVIVSAMMIGIGNLYYKGTSQASVQDNVRTITDEISQDLQLNGSDLLTGTNTNPALPISYCIGTTRYTSILGKQITNSSSLGANQSYHVLWRDSVPAGTCNNIGYNTFVNSSSPPTNPSTDPGTELIGPNSLLTYFTISTGISPFLITIGEAYGPSDLLCDSGYTSGGVNDCSNNTTDSTHIWNPNPPVNPLQNEIRCKGFAQNQLCSTDYLTTTVTERL